MIIKIVILVLYVALLLGIGIYTSSKAKTYKDYNLAGRSNNKWITGISTQSASTSGWMLLGLPGATFLLGFEAIWTLIGWIGGALINWLLIAKKLRVATEEYDSVSMVEFFQKRTNDTKGTVGLVAGLAIIIIMIVNSSAEIVGCGKLLSASFGIEYYLAVTIGLVIVMLYTYLGGFVAVSWTNLIQGAMMFLALLIAPLFIILVTGGFDSMAAADVALDPNYFSFLDGGLSFWGKVGAVTGGVGIAFMYPGYIHALTSIIAIKEKKEMAFSAFIALIWGAVALLGAAGIGMVGRALVSNIEDPEQVFLVLTDQYFPAPIAALFAAAVMAAILSSVCSYIIIVASSLGANIYKKAVGVEDEKKVVKIEKVAVIIISLLAYVLALRGGLVFQIAMFAASGLGASFGPLVIASIYSKNINKYGAIASIILGLATVVIWNLTGLGVYVYEVFPGWIASLAGLYIGSKVTGGADQETQLKFQQYKNKLS